MRVAEVTVWQVRIPLRKAIRHASHTRTETDNLLVRCRLDSGEVGYGEGVPRDYVTGETIDSALDLLRRSDLGSQFEPFDTFEKAVALAEHLHTAPVPGDDRHCQGNAARCAVELAFLDAACQALKRPLSDVTKLLTPELFAPKEHVRYSGAITSASGWKARWAAWKMWIYGFRQLKIKVGIEGQDDVKRLGSIRRRAGRTMDLRIDANEAWTPENVCQKILELKPFGITAVEQPVPHAQAACLREVRAKTAVPIMLDESLCSLIDGERAIAGGTCDLFNLRLSKCGGFIPSLRLAQLARRSGLHCQLGCQVGETAVLSAAGRHFASSVGDLRYLEGSYDSHLVKEALGTKNLTFGWGGWAPALPGPGLGISLDPDAIQRVAGQPVNLVG